MEKVIDITESVYQICTKYPELIKILEEIGFTDITKPGMLNTMGRFMTLDKGARMKKIEINEIQQKLLAKGFTLRKETGNE